MKRDFGKLVLPAVCLITGITLMSCGYIAWRTGRIILPATKHGPMTGPKAMIVGSLWCVFAAVWAWLAVKNDQKH